MIIVAIFMITHNLEEAVQKYKRSDDHVLKQATVDENDLNHFIWS